MPETETTTKSKEELARALQEMIVADNYHACVSVVFVDGGVKLVTHGTPTPQLEMGLIMQSIHTLWMRYQEVAQAVVSEMAEIARSNRGPAN